MKRVISFLCAVIAAAACLAGCGAEVQYDTDAIFSDLLELSEMPDPLELSGEKLYQTVGLDEEEYLSAHTAICGDSVRCDEIWVVETKDADAAEDVRSLAEARLERKKETLEGYLPEEYRIVCEAELLTEGRYVFLLVGPRAEVMRELVKKAG